MTPSYTMTQHNKIASDSIKRILAIDTSTHQLSVSLYANGQILQTCHTVEKHANAIIHSIKDLLHQAELRLQDIAIIAVNHGPGSFTGLRIGLATAQALAQANQQAMLTMSNCALYAFACIRRNTNLKIGDSIGVMLDAKLAQVYFAMYKIDSNHLPLVIESEQVINPEAITYEHTDGHCMRIGPGWEVANNKLNTDWSRYPYDALCMAGPTGIQQIAYSEIQDVREKLSMSSIMIDYAIQQEKKAQLTCIAASECKPNYLRHHVADTTEERRRKKNMNKTDSAL